MTIRPTDPLAPQLGGKTAIALFCFTLVAFVAESQLTQYVQTNLGYRQPFFLFYIVHSSFWIIFPLHILYLQATTKSSIPALVKGVTLAVGRHLSPDDTSSSSLEFPRLRFVQFILALTAGITLPALLWFAAVSLASIGDVTALWNTNAFFAYLFTVKLFRMKFQPGRLMAVSLATLGALVVVYGGSMASNDDPPHSDKVTETLVTFKPSAPLIGDLLTLMASVGYGLYQVLYKKYAALPSDPEFVSERPYEPLLADEDRLLESASVIDLEDAVFPPPFGLYPNMLTSAIGFCTFITLWLPIPILHFLGIEPFRLPENATTVFAIAGISLGGVIFNSGFMVLLGVWGPIIVSVGNLLTIVLVFLSDITFGAGVQAITTWSLVGSAAIVTAFAVLAYDMFSN